MKTVDKPKQTQSVSIVCIILIKLMHASFSHLCCGYVIFLKFAGRLCLSRSHDKPTARRARKSNWLASLKQHSGRLHMAPQLTTKWIVFMLRQQWNNNILNYIQMAMIMAPRQISLVGLG